MAWEFVIGIDFPPNLDIEVGTPSLPLQRWLVFGPYEGGNVVRRFGVIRYAEPVTFGTVNTVAETVVRPMWFNPTIIDLNNQTAGGHSQLPAEERLWEKSVFRVLPRGTIETCGRCKERSVCSSFFVLAF